MKRLLTLVFLIAPATFVWGQAATPAPAASTPAAPVTAAGAAPAPLACSKNVSFAIAEGGQPVPAIPKFTLKWLEGKSRKEQVAIIRAEARVKHPTLFLRETQPSRDKIYGALRAEGLIGSN